jgi:antitoxin ParD1/3/4
MPTRNVVLSDHQAELVDHLVSCGRFQNVSEALRAGLRLLEGEEIKLEEIQLRLRTSIEQARHQNATKSGADSVKSIFAKARDARG